MIATPHSLPNSGRKTAARAFVWAWRAWVIPVALILIVASWLGAKMERHSERGLDWLTTRTDLVNRWAKGPAPRFR